MHDATVVGMSQPRVALATALVGMSELMPTAVAVVSCGDGGHVSCEGKSSQSTVLPIETTQWWNR
jgi:hypothetical protein